MSTLTKNYIAVSEGRMTKAEFLRQARQGFPNVISPLNSYSDTIQILRSKGLLSEEVIRNCNSLNLPVESINRGVRYELEAMGYCIGSDSICPEDYKKAKAAAIDKLSKNRLHYYHLLSGTQKVGDQSDQMQKVTLKEAAGSRDMSLLHSWSIDDYKVAYIVCEFNRKKIGIEKLLEAAGLKGMQATSANVAINIIHCSPEALSIAVGAFKKFLIDGFQDSGKFLAGYKHVNNFQAVLKELKGKNVDECVASVNFENVGKSKDPDVIEKLEKQRDERNLKQSQRQKAETKDKKDLRRRLETIRIKAEQYQKEHPNSSPITALKAGFFTDANWNADTTRRAKNYGFITVNDKGEVIKIADDLLKESKEQTLLKEAITKRIVRILSEAATANLAQLSDEHASIQGVPAILNNLENIVTEVESFILKTQTKIQSAFDSIGDIRNEDGIPVGYKFVQPILDSFRKDLEPVLQKASLDNLKLPEAPEEDQIDIQTPEGNAELEIEPKQTMFTPKTPLAENKQPRKRYTR